GYADPSPAPRAPCARSARERRCSSAVNHCTDGDAWLRTALTDARRKLRRRARNAAANRVTTGANPPPFDDAPSADDPAAGEGATSAEDSASADNPAAGEGATSAKDAASGDDAA